MKTWWSSTASIFINTASLVPRVGAPSPNPTCTMKEKEWLTAREITLAVQQKEVCCVSLVRNLWVKDSSWKSTEYHFTLSAFTATNARSPLRENFAYGLESSPTVTLVAEVLLWGFTLREKTSTHL
mmetsp:Transcript_29643/g.41715  ORF Transcript_29643/g.41715 Transcript_29643/m.41715 type:complete len:126 (+) Transcript_29643:733-1110(+)